MDTLEEIFDRYLDAEAEDPERHQRQQQIRERAELNPGELLSFLDSLDFETNTTESIVSDVIEALSCRTPQHQLLLVQLWDWIVGLLKVSPNNQNLLFAVGSFEFVTHDFLDSQPAKKIGQALVEMMESEHKLIRRLSTDLVPSFFSSADSLATDSLLAALHDKDWKVRYLSRLALREWSLLPPDYSPGIFDRLCDWYQKNPIVWWRYV